MRQSSVGLLGRGPVPVVYTGPQPQQVVGPNLPLGGDYGTVVSYFITRGRPTYAFSDQPPNMALVAIELFAFLPGALMPLVYVYLDSSMVSESWFYVYRYVNNLAPPGPSTGAATGSSGPLVLISANVYLPPNEGIMLAQIPQSSGAVPAGSPGAVYYPANNPLLTQITLGNAPVLQPPWWSY
ncbi:MAG TPA: hypothetical protein VKT49_04005 [Bryobacteraceae bacterium]|nr:hypothetical protein [Bryobacteraceae bacterium]